jgi:pilus assembly protein CpaF
LDKLINEIERIFEDSVDYTEAMDDADVNFLIEKAVNSLCRKKHISLEKRKEIVRYLFNKRRKYGVLEPLIQDDDISEIMVNGEKEIFYEKEGRIFKYEEAFDSKETLIKIIRNMMLIANRTINEKNPIADARLQNGERICAVLDNIAINGPVLTIRKFSRKYISLDDLIKNNTLNNEMGEFIKDLVRQRYNIIVSGGTSSGKTTFLNVLSEFIDSGERVITIEDSLELNLEHVKNIIKLEVKEESLMIDAKKLLKTALRLRPDRIIVGEVRGREAFYMLQAMNTGHDGSMSTGHANSSRDMLSRLEGMVSSEFDIPVQSIKSYISSAVDILIHLKKTFEGKRIVREIIQLAGVTGNEYITNTLYEFREGKFSKCKQIMPKGN